MTIFKSADLRAFRRLREFTREWDVQRPEIEAAMATAASWTSEGTATRTAISEVYKKSSDAQRAYLLVPTPITSRAQERTVQSLLDLLDEHGVPGGSLLAPNVSKFGPSASHRILTAYFSTLKLAAISVVNDIEGGGSLKTQSDPSRAGICDSNGRSESNEGSSYGEEARAVAEGNSDIKKLPDGSFIVPSMAIDYEKLQSLEATGRNVGEGVPAQFVAIPPEAPGQPWKLARQTESERGGEMEGKREDEGNESTPNAGGVAATASAEVSEGGMALSSPRSPSAVEGLAMAGGALIAGGLAAAGGGALMATSGAAIAGGLAAATIASGFGAKEKVSGEPGEAISSSDEVNSDRNAVLENGDAFDEAGKSMGNLNGGEEGVEGEKAVGGVDGASAGEIGPVVQDKAGCEEEGEGRGKERDVEKMGKPTGSRVADEKNGGGATTSRRRRWACCTSVGRDEW